jgi:hypothetical protein
MSMHIVTVMNYAFADERPLVMCRMWMESVQRLNPGARVTVLATQPLPERLAAHFRAFGNVCVEVRPYDKSAQVLRSRHAMHNIFFKLHHLCGMDAPFIYLDADAIPLSSLDFLWQRRLDKPWIGIDHQLRIPGHTGDEPFLNSGVQVVGDPAFCGYSELIELARECGFRWRVPGADQALLHTHFRRIGYDYTHPEIGPEWNACAGFVDLTTETGGSWAGATRAPMPRHAVHVNHYWGPFKPWQIGCPMYAQSCAMWA